MLQKRYLSAIGLFFWTNENKKEVMRAIAHHTHKSFFERLKSISMNNGKTISIQLTCDKPGIALPNIIYMCNEYVDRIYSTSHTYTYKCYVGNGVRNETTALVASAKIKLLRT